MMLRRVLAFALLAVALVVGRGYWNATRDPIVRAASVHIRDWPKGAAPVRILLVSDVHISGPDMPPGRVVRIAAQLNALHPDLFLIAGDLGSAKKLATHWYGTTEIAEALRAFRAPLGTIVVMGNHDHWYDDKGYPPALGKAGLIFLQNSAIKRGPLVIGGVDDGFTHHDDLAKTQAAMAALEGPRIILTHDPDLVAHLRQPVVAVFAGHTHCGQIVNPFSRQPVTSVSPFGHRFLCGDITDRGQRLFVSAGLGTSLVSLRYGVPPDVWLVTLGP
jgi:predicted MPP superfamily phosphohydrolase